MRTKRKVIGLSGVAGAGKDLFFRLLSKKLSIRRFALADQLKDETRPWTLEHYGIDATNCNRFEKDVIRPFLVDHGKIKRERSNGRHWIDLLDYKIKGFLLNAQTEDIPCVTDIRYNIYDRDEVHWIKEELEGVLVHIKQWKWFKDIEEGALVKQFREPINKEEEKNDPLVQRDADYRLEWEYTNLEYVENQEILEKEVDKFVLWYNES